MPSRRRQFNRSSSRPNRGWSGRSALAPATIPANSKVLITTLVNGTSGVDLTILRSVGMISVASDQATNVESQLGAYGWILVTDVAAAAGIASVPGPLTDASDDWFLYISFAQQSFKGTGQGPQSVQYMVNSKAKRIFDGDGKVIAVVCENGHATHGLTIADEFRVLSQVRGTQ